MEEDSEGTSGQSPELTFKMYQKIVDDWISQFEEGYFPPFEIMAQMSEETGEIAREMNYLHGTKNRKPGEKASSLKGEIGDLLFAICCLANSHKIDLAASVQKTIDKFTKRDTSRFTLKEGTKD